MAIFYANIFIVYGGAGYHNECMTHCAINITDERGKSRIGSEVYRYAQHRSRSTNICCPFKSGKRVASGIRLLARVKFSRLPIAILRVSARRICISRRHGALQIMTASFIERTNNLNNRWR